MVESLDEPALLDRKSTRLNSSHLVISYAVFCLKKKTLGAPDVVRISQSSLCSQISSRRLAHNHRLAATGSGRSSSPGPRESALAAREFHSPSALSELPSRPPSCETQTCGCTSFALDATRRYVHSPVIRLNCGAVRGTTDSRPILTNGESSN